MEEKEVQETEAGVTQLPTEELKEEVLEEVIETKRRASVEDIKNLPCVRKAKAEAFVIPGTELEVLVAPSSQSDRYKAMISSLAAIKASDDKDESQKVKIIENMANSLLKACVVEPELDDEAIAALNEFSADGVTALLSKCRQVSGMDTADDSQAMENFIFGNLLGMS